MGKSPRTFYAARTTPRPPTRPPSLGCLQGRLRRSLSLSFSLTISSGERMTFLHRRHFVPSRFVVLSSRNRTVLSKQQQASAYLMRHPPTCTGLKPQPYRVFCSHTTSPGQPVPSVATVHKAVKNFHTDARPRRRKLGYRKTVPTI